MTRLTKYLANRYAQVEAETGLSTGFRQTGLVTVALTADLKEEILRSEGVELVYGVTVEQLSPAEFKKPQSTSEQLGRHCRGLATGRRSG